MMVYPIIWALIICGSLVAATIKIARMESRQRGAAMKEEFINFRRAVMSVFICLWFITGFNFVVGIVALLLSIPELCPHRGSVRR